jgi:TPR repeat protein
MRLRDQFQLFLSLVMESANKGHTDAQTALGHLFELNEDYSTAKKWYESISYNIISSYIQCI